MTASRIALSLMLSSCAMDEIVWPVLALAAGLVVDAAGVDAAGVDAGVDVAGVDAAGVDAAGAEVAGAALDEEELLIADAAEATFAAADAEAPPTGDVPAGLSAGTGVRGSPRQGDRSTVVVRTVTVVVPEDDARRAVLPWLSSWVATAVSLRAVAPVPPGDAAFAVLDAAGLSVAAL